MTDVSDDRVKAWIVKAFREEFKTLSEREGFRPASYSNEARHLCRCYQTRVDDVDTEAGESDTGAEWANLVAMLACDHGHVYEYTYGDWGDIPMIIEYLEREYDAKGCE